MVKDTCLGLERQVAQWLQEAAQNALQKIALEGRRIANQGQHTLLHVHITYKQKGETINNGTKTCKNSMNMT